MPDSECTSWVSECVDGPLSCARALSTSRRTSCTSSTPIMPRMYLVLTGWPVRISVSCHTASWGSWPAQDDDAFGQADVVAVGVRGPPSSAIPKMDIVDQIEPSILS